MSGAVGRAGTSWQPRTGVLVAAGLAIIAGTALPAMTGPFIWDDRMLILENPATVELQPLGQYFASTFWQPTADRPGFAGYYRPLVSLSYALQYQLSGDSPVPFHLFNLAVHLAAAYLLYCLARRFGAGAIPAVLAMTAWGAFPRLTECVDWISGRTDLLAGFFTLGAMLAWDAARPARRLAAGVLLLLGLFSKEVALATLPAIAVWEVWAGRGRPGAWRAVVVRLAPLGAAVATWAWLRTLAQRGGPVAESSGLTALERSTRALDALGTYVWMVAAPFRPSALVSVAGRPVGWRIAVGGALVLAAAAVSVQAWRRWRPPVAMAMAMGGAALVPVLHFVDIHLMVAVADRFLYLPLAGLALALGITSSQLAGGRARAAAAAAALLVAAWAPAAFLRAQDYGDEAAFWLSEAARAPRELAVPRAQLGAMLFREGRFEAAAQVFRGALQDMRQASFFQREFYGKLEVNVALCLAQLERNRAALQVMGALLDAQPEVASHWLDRARILLAGQEWAAAQRDLDEALRLFPGFEQARVAAAIGARAAAEWEALPPPEAPRQTTADLAARARILDRTDARSAAGRCWCEVLKASDSLSADRRAAANFLVRYGPPDRARWAVQAYAAAGATDAQLLEDLLDLRLQRLAELDAVQAALGL